MSVGNFQIGHRVTGGEQGPADRLGGHLDRIAVLGQPCGMRERGPPIPMDRDIQSRRVSGHHQSVAGSRCVHHDQVSQGNRADTQPDQFDPGPGQDRGDLVDRGLGNRGQQDRTGLAVLVVGQRQKIDAHLVQRQ